MAWVSQLSTYALISLAELNSALGVDAQTDANNRPQDDRKEVIINGASLAIEQWLDRHLVTRGSLTEYHTPEPGQTKLYLGEWPVTSVTTVHEHTSWATTALASRYPASTLLVADTDYQADKPTREPDCFGALLRLTGSWASGFRVVKVVYAAGYATTSVVPKAIKAACIELCGLMWRDRSKNEFGVISRTDATGSITRNVPAILTDLMQSQLRMAGYRPRAEFTFGAETWERVA